MPDHADTPARKLRDPGVFDGSPTSNLRKFLAQVQLSFQDNPSAFPDDSTKVNYALSYLEDKAFLCFEPHLTESKQPAWRTDFSLFKAELEKMFGHTQNKFKTAQDLKGLKQTSSVLAYTIEFHQLTSRLQWANEPLVFSFYAGLKNSIKAELVKNPRALDLGLEDLITLATNAEAFSIPFDQAPAQAPKRPSRPAKRDPPSGYHLTEEERERRRKNNLCVYCAGKDHFVRDCPQRPKDPLSPAHASEAVLKTAEPLGNEPTQSQ
jgi:hypothetical protein